MKFTQGITYILMIIMTFIILYFLQDYFILAILDMFNVSIYYKTIIMILINIFINPILVAIILRDFKFINKPWN